MSASATHGGYKKSVEHFPWTFPPCARTFRPLGTRHLFLHIMPQSVVNTNILQQIHFILKLFCIFVKLSHGFHREAAHKHMYVWLLFPQSLIFTTCSTRLIKRCSQYRPKSKLSYNYTSKPSLEVAPHTLATFSCYDRDL